MFANLKYYQADDVTSHKRLVFRKTMLRNTMFSNSVRWRH